MRAVTALNLAGSKQYTMICFALILGTMEKIRVALEHPSEAESLMVPDHLFGAKSLSAEALEAYLGQIKHANSMSRSVDLS